MFLNIPIRGDRLPEKTLCLTFDDGPGPQTLPLASYLSQQGIQGTFFVIGEHVRNHPETVQALRDMGHLLASHTESHQNLLDELHSGGNIPEQVLSADLLIRSGAPAFFRAPGGAWRHRGGRLSPVAAALNRSAPLDRCCGPVHWDIEASDWLHWKNRQSAERCAAAYLKLIGTKRRGIVLVHDSSWEPDIREGNLCLAMMRILVPRLIAKGYRFVRLDFVPQAASATLVKRCVTLQAGNLRLSASTKAGGRVKARAGETGPGETWILRDSA